MVDLASASDTGVIFDVQRFSLHDGEGIRTLVFMKGCSLRCLWCCNPESQSSTAELSVSTARCIQCGLCADACPHAAIASGAGNEGLPDRARCHICGACVPACPCGARAVRGRTVTVEALVSEVERDALVYRSSGGGVTVSGGEPLQQPRFVAAFLSACRQRGIPTAIETCGYAPWEDFTRVLEHTDLTLFDLKHPDSDSHRRMTGVGTEVIIANLEQAAAAQTNIIVRMPLIPEHNADIDTVRAVASLTRKLGIRELHLLPYHGLGEAKYRSLGKEYALAHVSILSREQLQALKRAAESSGITVRLGG